MKLKCGDIFKDFDNLDYVGITTNSIVKRNGELVMGAGVAKTAKEHNKHLPVLFGSQILANDLSGKFYGVLIQGKYFAFQTKRHFKFQSDINDVIKSIHILKDWSINEGDKVFGLPFPAINNGGLDWKDIILHLEDLPDNVIVYHLNKLK